MKSINKRIICLVVLLSLLCCFVSCRRPLFVDAATKFYIDDIVFSYEEDFCGLEKYEYARVESVTIIPGIKQTQIDDPLFSLGVSVYSKTGTEIVTVKNVYFKENNNVLLTYTIDKQATFNPYTNGMYRARFFGIDDNLTFTDEDIEIKTGKTYELVVDVEFLKDDDTVIEKSISYTVSMQKVQMLNCPALY